LADWQLVSAAPDRPRPIGTGSLFLSIALHAVLDLQILWMVRPDLDDPGIDAEKATENFFA
jgi:hypothetical protein